MNKSFNRSFNKNDELYTPEKLVNIIIPYVQQFTKKESLYIWCPFDTKDSEYVRVLQKMENVKVIYTSIESGDDFFKTEPEKWDIAISNPPFSRKKDIFKRLFSLGKPFAMLMNIMAINYQEIGYLFAENPVQMLVPDKKVSFNGKTSSFCSGYVCKDFLPKDLIFCHMPDNNTGLKFIPAKQYKNLHK